VSFISVIGNLNRFIFDILAKWSSTVSSISDQNFLCESRKCVQVAFSIRFFLNEIINIFFY
jgi:hypothetical protein